MTQDVNRRWGFYLLGILLAAFAVVLAVNITLAVMASRSNSGLVSEHAYEDGLDYNKELNLRQAQAELGWHVHVAHNLPAGLQAYEITDAQNAPLTGATVTFRAAHAVENMPGVTLTLPETAPGHYEAPAPLARGPWNVTLTIVQHDKTFEAVRRIIVP